MDKTIESKLVRVDDFKIIWNFEKINEYHTRVTYDLYSNAGLPGWLDEMVNKVGPVNSLLKLREQMSN